MTRAVEMIEARTAEHIDVVTESPRAAAIILNLYWYFWDRCTE